MIRRGICKGGGGIDSHIETEAKSIRYVVKTIKKVGVSKYNMPLFGN